MKTIFAIITCLGLLPAYSATIADPALASGPGDVIDPTGSETVDQNFGTAQATLEARSDLRVLQDFTGFAASAGGNNVVSFTTTTLPDIQFQFSGDYSTTQAGGAATLSGTNYATTSGTSALSVRNISNVGTESMTITISFGTWNGSSFTSDQTVAAAGFTMTQLALSRTGTVTFRDSTGTAISGAAFAYAGANSFDASGNHRDIYFGWDAAAQSSSEIGSITISVDTASAVFSSYFDDLAFTTVIPEPSSLVLSSIGCLFLLRRRR